MNKPELYFSCDIETDGPIPGPNSMLSFGVVALDTTGKIHGKFSENLATLPGSSGDPDTMEWWTSQPDAWRACRSNIKDPTQVMNSFVEWSDKFRKTHNIVMVCMPAGFDFMFMYWYMIKFAGRSPFSFSCIDMKTFVMASQKLNYKNCGKSSWKKGWFPEGTPHTHIALDDALEQGLTFINILKDNNDG